MHNIFRILLLGALPLAAFPVIQASAQEPDIQTLLSGERSSFISGKARNILCRKLGTANLDTDKIRAMAHAPQVALLCHLYQFFSAAETENRSRSMNSRTSHSGNGSPPTRKSSECLPYPGQPANKPYPYFTASGTRTIKRSAPLKPAWLWGQGLPQMSSLLKNACPNSIFTGNPTSNPHAIPRRTRCSRGNGPSFSVAERAWKTCPGPSSS